MDKFVVLLKAVFTGLTTGLFVSIPLGPAGLESVKRTISKGYKEGLLVSLGAVAGDTFDIVLINFGLLNLLEGHKKAEAVVWIISGIILIIVGYLSIKGNEKLKKLETEPTIAKNKALKSMPFLTGFFIVISNPLTHSLWITLSGTVISVWRYKGDWPYYTFLVSIVVGMVAWFSMLNFFALKGHRKLSNESSDKISSVLMWSLVVIGIGFIVYGAYVLIFVV